MSRPAKLEHPAFVQGIVAEFDVNSVSELECPECHGEMLLSDCGPEGVYFQDGRFERTERYCCECGAFAEVVQVYRPAERRAAVYRIV